jgi:hypothetical protein
VSRLFCVAPASDGREATTNPGQSAQSASSDASPSAEPTQRHNALSSPRSLGEAPTPAEPQEARLGEAFADNRDRVSIRELAGLIPALPILVGPVVYAVAAYGYDGFYFRLGTTPSEVGLGYLEVLTFAIPALTILMLAAIVVSGLTTVWIHYLPGRSWLVSHKIAVRIVSATLLMVLAILYGVFGLGKDVRAAALAVENGQEPKSVRIMGFTLLHLEAPRVRIEWDSSGMSPPRDSLASRNVQLYELGTTPTHIVLFELKVSRSHVVTRSVVTIPSNAAIILSISQP